MRYRSLYLIAGVGLCLQGCKTGQDYQAPVLSTPAQWSTAHSNDFHYTQGWWHHFQDPTLNALIAQALAYSPDLQAAHARILEARAYQHMAAANRYPQVDANVDASRGNAATIQSKTQSLFQAALDASFELDIFGAQARELEAATAKTQSSEADYQAVRLSLIGEVASTYTEWRTAQQQTHNLQKICQLQHQQWALYKARHDAGLEDARLALDTAARYREGQAALAAGKERAEQARLKLGILIGATPQSLPAALSHAGPIPYFATAPLLASPARVLAQRPDIRMAERLLAQATALENTAIAKMYPNISLSALLGFQDGSLFAGRSIWSGAGALSTPLFDFGRLDAVRLATQAQTHQALHAYEGTVLAALADVEIHLHAHQTAQLRNQALAAALADDRVRLNLEKAYYSEGLETQLPALAAEERLYMAQQASIEAQGDQSQAAIALCKSLGLGEPQPEGKAAT